MRSRVLPTLTLAAIVAGCAGHASIPSTGAASDAVLAPDQGGLSTTTPARSATGVPEQRLGDVRFVVSLPLRNEAELDRLLAATSDPQSPQYRHFLTHDAFMQRYAPNANDLAAVAADFQRAGLSVAIMDQAVAVGGSQTQIERYFHTSFARSAQGAISPRSTMLYNATLSSRHARILGLNGETPMHTFSQFRPLSGGIRPDNFNSAIGPYYPLDLKQAYQMPSYQDATGKGVTIGIVIDSPVQNSDIDLFFKTLHLPTPGLTQVKINGGGTTADAGESTLDVEQSGGIAPGAKIVLYDIASLSGQDIYNGYAALVHAGKATVANSSFGGCETNLTKSDLSAYDSVFKQGIASGVTFVAASGDHGAFQCGTDLNAAGVSWPAVSPYVVAVGGTNLTTAFTSGSNNSAYVKETAFRDTKPNNGGDFWGSGGGYSKQYARPSYQSGFVTKAGRGVPDVALHMGGLGFSGQECLAEKCGVDDSSDYEVEDGGEGRAVGTSASSPDMVGLLALASEIAKSPLGDVHTLLYSGSKSGAFRRGIAGNNGLPTTSGPWDPVLGLGTPIAAYKFVGARAAAGIPGTASNP